MKIAILDDYQDAALKMADWSALSGRAEITVFNDHFADPSALLDESPDEGIQALDWERRPDSARALGADRPTPTAPFPILASLCFQ